MDQYPVLAQYEIGKEGSEGLPDNRVDENEEISENKSLSGGVVVVWGYTCNTEEGIILEDGLLVTGDKLEKKSRKQQCACFRERN